VTRPPETPSGRGSAGSRDSPAVDAGASREKKPLEAVEGLRDPAAIASSGRASSSKLCTLVEQQAAERIVQPFGAVSVADG